MAIVSISNEYNGALQQSGLADYYDIVLGNNPIAYWPLNETSGNTAYDLSGNNNTGTYENSPSLGESGPSEQISMSVYLDGSSQGVNTATLYSPVPFPYSEEAWFKTSASSPGVILGFSSVQGTGCATWDRLLYFNSSGQIYTNVSNSPTTADSYNDDKWHHVVITMGSNGCVIYVDGAAVVSSSITTTQSYNGYVNIGYTCIGTNPCFTGNVAQIAIYNTVLTPAQVSRHYAAGML